MKRPESEADKAAKVIAWFAFGLLGFILFLSFLASSIASHLKLSP